MKQMIAFLVITAMISCNQKPGIETPAGAVNVDSLTAQFVRGWNEKDSTAIVTAIADNAVLINDTVIYRDLAAISKNWVSGGVKVVSDLKTSAVFKDSDDKMAYDAGTYTHDLTLPDRPPLKINGNYSFAWRKQSGGEWKLTFIHIEDLTRMP